MAKKVRVSLTNIAESLALALLGIFTPVNFANTAFFLALYLLAALFDPFIWDIFWKGWRKEWGIKNWADAFAFSTVLNSVVAWSFFIGYFVKLF